MVQVQARIQTLTQLYQQCRLRAKALQLKRDQTQAILEAVGEAVIVTDRLGVIQYLNPAAITATGYQLDEAVGRPWRLLYATEDTGKLDKILAKVQAGKTWQGEVVSRRKDDSIYQVALTVAPLFETENTAQTNGFVSVQRDITLLKETEQAHDEFISNVSHELRTPLSVITLIGDNLEALYDRLDDNNRLRMIRDIQKHSQVLKDLIGDSLELSRIDSKHISSERETLNLAQLVREEVDKLMPLVQEKSHILSLDLADDIPVYGNAGQLQQIIRNLLNNAIKYTDEGGLIDCQCKTLNKDALKTIVTWPKDTDLPAGRWAIFQVKDNGIGISAEHLPRLFERFYRIKAQQKIRGTGLGLAITRELVELHNGHIGVSSTPGEGSIFALYLPLQER
jgi:PAS domain S-box-containing protein